MKKLMSLMLAWLHRWHGCSRRRCRHHPDRVKKTVKAKKTVVKKTVERRHRKRRRPRRRDLYWLQEEREVASRSCAALLVWHQTAHMKAF